MPTIRLGSKWAAAWVGSLVLPAIAVGCGPEPKVWPKAVDPDPASLGVTCEDLELPPLAPIATAEWFVMGPCGHVVYRDPSDEFMLVALDGSQQPGGGLSPTFSAAGDQLAWRTTTGDSTSVVLRDLITNEDQTTNFGSSEPSFGFVPERTFAGAPRPWMWSCSDQEGLFRHGPAGASLMTEPVWCRDLAPSEGSTRVAFSSTEPVVGIVDLADGVVVSRGNPSPIDQPAEVLFPWLDHHGSMMIVNGALDLGESPDDWEYEYVWARLLDEQLMPMGDPEVVGSYAQGSDPGTPLWMGASGGLYRASSDSGVELVGATEDAPGNGLARESGHLFFHGPGDPAPVMRIGPEAGAEPEWLFDGPPDASLRPSPRGHAVVSYSWSTDPKRVLLWLEGEGVREMDLEWEWFSLMRLREDGGMRVWGKLDAAADADREQFFWIDGDGEVLAHWYGSMLDGWFESRELPDGRLLVHSPKDRRESPTPWHLALLYPNVKGVRWLLDGVAVGSNVGVSADGRRLAFIEWDEPDSGTLWYGAMPD